MNEYIKSVINQHPIDSTLTTQERKESYKNYFRSQDSDIFIEFEGQDFHVEPVELQNSIKNIDVDKLKSKKIHAGIAVSYTHLTLPTILLV